MRGRMRVEEIRIRRDGSVDKVHIGLSKNHKDEAEWEDQHKAGPWTVLFGPGTPFSAGHTFLVPKGGSVPSGPLHPKVGQGDVFPYVVLRPTLLASLASGAKQGVGAKSAATRKRADKGKGGPEDQDVRIDP